MIAMCRSRGPIPHYLDGSPNAPYGTLGAVFYPRQLQLAAGLSF
jgi:hypothetical protein